MVQLAIDMDRDGEGVLNREYAHITPNTIDVVGSSL